MDIQDALEPTGEARKGSNLADYAHLVKDEDSDRHSLMWVIDGKNDGNVQYEDIFDDDWQPYHEVKEIRPWKAGELWRGNITGIYYHTEIFEQRLVWASDGMRLEIKEGDHHNKTMTRIYPAVEDENVERLEIEWTGYRGGDEICFSLLDDPFHNPIKEKMKYRKGMILLIPKDKP